MAGDERETVETGEPIAAGQGAEAAAGLPDGAGDELGRLRAQAADYEDRWKRSAAEFINYKRRTEGERGEILRGANGALILELLPVLDDLERAMANVPADQAQSPWVEGVRLVERKYRAILERQGVTAVEAVGRPFDPAVHEAIGGAGETVVQEYQRGYQLNGRTLRPAMVIVGDETADGRRQSAEQPAGDATAGRLDA